MSHFTEPVTRPSKAHPHGWPPRFVSKAWGEPERKRGPGFAANRPQIRNDKPDNWSTMK